tara:strand:- start:13 stop:486 length:474 start_codon:yes stop_codon:yes gene_type:complete
MLAMMLYSSSKDSKELQAQETSITLDTTATRSKAVEIGRATIYNAVAAQCDHDPFTTADGSYIDTNKLKGGNLNWIALSQDLIDDSYKARLHKGLFKGQFQFGDSILVISKEWPSMSNVYIVHDVMNKRYRKAIDFLMPIETKNKFRLGRDFKLYKL